MGEVARPASEVNSEKAALIKYDAMCRAIEQAHAVDEVKDIRDKAIAMEVYCRQAKNLEAEQRAAEIRLRAERRAGELLRDSEKAKGARGNPGGQGARIVQSPDATAQKTLAELGISKGQSSRWQKLAAVPKAKFEAALAAAITPAKTTRIVREHEREQKRDDNRRLVTTAPPAIRATSEPVPTIVIDPPWDWSDEGDQDQLGRARPTYHTMTIDEIAALPIGQLAQPSAHLYLWITNRSLPKGFALLERWGFRYITCLTWCKPSIGMGNYFRGSSEQILFGVRGSLPLLRSDLGTWFAAPRCDRHSGKPEEFYKTIESCSPGPWLDMFAREPRPGWHTWGAEV